MYSVYKIYNIKDESSVEQHINAFVLCPLLCTLGNLIFNDAPDLDANRLIDTMANIGSFMVKAVGIIMGQFS